MTWQVYTDGGARPNPGPGGWGAVLLNPQSGERRELSGGEPHTTNNRMELTAAIRALEELEPDAPVDLHTDSRYLRQGITSWLPRWIARGWRRADDGAVKNQDLWRRLAELDARHRVRWHWLKGHAGHEHNERADELATLEIERLASSSQSTAEASPQTSEEPDVEAWIKTTHRRGRGAWVALVITAGEQTSFGASSNAPSANRVELEAGLEVLRRIDPQVLLAIGCGDYLRRGATEWLPAWKRAGWKTSSGDPVKNRDLWSRLDRELADRRILWRRAPKTGALAGELRRRLAEAEASAEPG